VKKTLGVVFVVLGLAILFYLLFSLSSQYGGEIAVVQTYKTLMSISSNTEGVRDLPVVTTPVQTVIPTVEPTPERVMVVTNGLNFANTIDLSSGDPVALILELPNGNLLKTNWAETKKYESDDPEGVFSPLAGTIYSYESDVATTWAHSGVISGDILLNIPDKTFFATDLDLFVRKDENNRVVTLADAEAQANTLVGSTAYLCQMPSGEVKNLADFEGDECLGQKLELEIVAFAIVPHEMILEYDEANMYINQWMKEKFPGTGFEQLTKENGWILRFCVGKFADQTSDGTPSYLYNRGVIGFRVKDRSS